MRAGGTGAPQAVWGNSAVVKGQRILAALVDLPAGLLQLGGQHDAVALEFLEGLAPARFEEPVIKPEQQARALARRRGAGWGLGADRRCGVVSGNRHGGLLLS